jgi:hypothetical protein
MFVKRTRTFPTLDQATELERVWLVDQPPSAPGTGAGWGKALIVGEFEDGPFNTPVSIYGDTHRKTLFGGFGYQYGSLTGQNPSARQHLTELWNGNGFIKLSGLKFPKLCVCRVDTSVGNVRFTLAAARRTNAAPFSLAHGDQLSVTTDSGGPANSTAVDGHVATITGGALGAGLANGDQCSIGIDHLPVVTITFQASDTTRALIAARINSFMGYACASDTGVGVKIDGIQAGTGGHVILADVTAGVLAKIGHIAGTTNGTGNVDNLAAVTAAELVTLIRSGAILAINGEAMADANTGQVVVYRTGSATGTIRCDDVAGTPCVSVGLTTGLPVTKAEEGPAFSLPAGTRVRNAGATEWVTMRTISWPVGTAAAPNVATQDVEVRPGLDNGTIGAAPGGTVNVEVDLPTDRMVEVTNPANLSAALTEAQIDARYATAWNATLSPEFRLDATWGLVGALDVNVSFAARRSDAVIRQGRQNAIDASENGCYGRKFVSGAVLGTTQAVAFASVTAFRSDRVKYVTRGWYQTIPEIADVGAAGGVGFSDSGQMLLRADALEAMLQCTLNPEENVGQDAGLLTMVEGLELVSGDTWDADAYIAAKAAGIMCLHSERNGAYTFQSDVTSDLTPGLTTGKRRAFADYAEDSAALTLLPYGKKLATDARIAGAYAALDRLCAGWLSKSDPNSQRIKECAITNITGQHPEWTGRGVVGFQMAITQLDSMDTIVVLCQVGEGTVITAA